jgi:hypothetical protein
VHGAGLVAVALSVTNGVDAHPVYAGGKDNGVRILSHANTDFRPVTGAPEGGKVRTYQDFEAHKNLDVRGNLTLSGKPVATEEDVAFRVAEVRTWTEGNIRDLEGKLDNVTAGLEVELISQQARADNITNKLDDAEERIDALKDIDVVAIQFDLTQLKKDVDEEDLALKALIKENEDDIGVLQSSMQSANGKIAANENLGASLNHDMNNGEGKNHKALKQGGR